MAAGRVAALGGEAIEGLVGPNTRVIELGGDTVLPGFNDAHAHIVYAGLTSFGVRLATCTSIAAIQARLRARLPGLGPGEWLQGRGYSLADLREGRPPTRSELDEAVGPVPCFIDERGGHARVANSAALTAAAITRDTPEPPGGSIGRDEHGEPDGRLNETAMRLVADRQPAPTLSRREAGLLRSQRMLLARGITSVGAAVNRGFADDLRAYTRLEASGRLRIRVNQFLSWELLPAAADLGPRSRFGSRLVRAGPVKVFIDGGAAAAALRSGGGVWRTPPDELRALVRRAQEAGWQVAAHAIGDAASAALLDAVEELGPPARAARHRLEHFTLAPADLRERAARLGVMAVMQPLAAAHRDLLAALAGADPADLAPHAGMASAGVPLAFSSDYPVAEDPNPWAGISAAIREPATLTLAAALRAYTWGGAYASHEESVKGSLMPGQMADLQAYTGDPLEAAALGLTSRPRWVALAGRTVYGRP